MHDYLRYSDLSVQTPFSGKRTGTLKKWAFLDPRYTKYNMNLEDLTGQEARKFSGTDGDTDPMTTVGCKNSPNSSPHPAHGLCV